MVKMGYVWDRTVDTLGERLSVILPLAVIGIFLPSIALSILQPLATGASQGAALGFSLLSLIGSLVSIATQLAIVAAAIDVQHTAAQAARIGARRLLPALGAFILLALAGIVLTIPMLMLLVAGGVDAAAMQSGQVSMERLNGNLVGIASLYGFVVLVVGLVLLARLAPLTAVVVAERRGAGAIARTFRLTKGLTWRLVGVFLLYGVVTLVATLAARTVFGTVLRLFDSGQGAITLTSIGTALATSVVSAVFTVLATVFCARLYVAIVGVPGAAVVAGAAPARASDPAMEGDIDL